MADNQANREDCNQQARIDRNQVTGCQGTQCKANQSGNSSTAGHQLAVKTDRSNRTYQQAEGGKPDQAKPAQLIIGRS